MRFGHFFYPMKFDDARDEQEIQDCLTEAQLVERESIQVQEMLIVSVDPNGTVTSKSLPRLTSICNS